MADALFRKDIRRQKRELTAIRKARKPRNKPPGYLILPVRGARYPGVLSIMKSGSSAPLYGFSPDHSRKVGALSDKRTSRAETRGASAEAVHRSAAVRCAGGIHADLPSQLAVGKFRNIHQCVKSFDKHGDLSAFFSII